MSAMTTLPFRPDGWTVDDLDELPEDDPLRYELVDGALLVTPPPKPWHDDLGAQLLLTLLSALPREYRASTAPGVYFDHRNYRQPDVAVYRRGAALAERIWATDCLLVVETVSPSSVANDTVAKPAQYAAAGIPHYWRVHRQPLLLVAHALEGAVYREAGRFDDAVELEQPVPLRFRLTDLLP
ncbi:MAG TPA: Uma2 family endonuclease [Mycobacteriales bacterium]|nr:Uma2 family endonuclease [Mycobacteriales bacterium]